MVPVEDRTADIHAVPRVSTYLAATLFSDGSASPVKIRNISASGALVECTAKVAEGSLVQLVRGSLIVHGLIAWAANGRCGIKFSGTVDVHSWRATPVHAEQQRVDEIVRLVKAGAVPLPVPSLVHRHEATPASSPQASLSADLQRISELLKSMEAVFANDEDVVARHGTTLQKLDIAMQLLEVLDGVATSDLDLEIETTKIASLRRSADQALQTSASPAKH